MPSPQSQWGTAQVTSLSKQWQLMLQWHLTTLHPQLSKTDALDTLMAVNKQLAEALAHIKKENEKLLTMVSQLTTYTTKPIQCKQSTPNSYCWTHGFVMCANHTSKTCNNKASGHKVEATKDNTMEGNLANK